MYEMYPDAWALAEARQQARSDAKPRRRPRKEHSVLPPVIAHQLSKIANAA
jgi:hypothetical protein